MPLTLDQALAQYPQMQTMLRFNPTLALRQIAEWEAAAAAGGPSVEAQYDIDLAESRARRRGLLTLGISSVVGLAAAGISAARRAAAAAAAAAARAPIPLLRQLPLLGAVRVPPPTFDLASSPWAPVAAAPTVIDVPGVALAAPAGGSAWSRFWSWLAPDAPSLITAFGIGAAGTGIGVGAAGAGLGYGYGQAFLPAPAAVPLTAPALGDPSVGINWDLAYLMR